MKRNYRQRIIDRQISKYLAAFGAVCLEGPKWCGKTWTASFHSASEIYLGDSEGNFQNRQLALVSPKLVLEGATPRLIDEWQEVPSLWDAVRHFVDQTGQKGLFILTGSSTPLSKGVLHSGAGRIARLRLRPMSLHESGSSSGLVSLHSLCQGQLAAVPTGNVELKNLAELIVCGGWPGNLGLPPEQAALIPGEYLHAVLETDVRRLDGIDRNMEKMKLLLLSLARNESTLATNKTLIRDIKALSGRELDDNTVATYLDVFHRLFLIDDQPPFSPALRSSLRVRQSVKRHLSDPSLACALLGATPSALINDLETMGFLFEALCERDLRIYAESFGAKLYHYRDYDNMEIDAVVALPDGRWCAFEIKLGASQIDSAAASLLAISRKISATAGGRPPSVLCVICGMSTAAYQRPDGVYVVPITALRE